MKKTARTIVTAASVAPFALIAPIAVGAVVVPSEEVTVKQPLGDVWMDAVESELGGSFQVGDSITIDLDDIFDNNLGDLNLTYINTNSNVAEVTLLSGDLHIGGKNAGSTIVELIARKWESQGPAVHERFVLHVANNNRIVDANQDGITIDDIVRYMSANPGKMFRREELGYLLNQIKPAEAAVNQPPISDWETYDIYVKQNQPYTIDVKSFFFDEEGDSLTYSAGTWSSGAAISTEITSGSLLTVLTEESSGPPLTVWVEANDGHSEYGALKVINVIVEEEPVEDVNHAPIIENPYIQLVVEEDGLTSDSIRATDEDGDALSFFFLENASHGSVELNSITGSFTYTPDENYYGEDIFVVAVSDGNSAPVTATVNVTITPVNDKPIGYNINPIIVTQDESVQFVVPGSGMFIDPEGDEVFYRDVKLLVEQGGQIDLPDWINFDDVTGTFTFAPTSNNVGIYKITITGYDQSNDGNFVHFDLIVTGEEI